MSYLLVFLGSGIGGLLRHIVGVASARWLGIGFPVGTMCVNVIGSACMGAVAAYFAFRGTGANPLRLFLTTGVIGGFTTFATFSLDTLTLAERGEVAAAAGYAALSLLLSLAAVFVAWQIMRAVL